jgi:hypothetical protein
VKVAFITHAIVVGGAALSSSTTIRYLLDKGLLRPEECVIIHDNPGEISPEKTDVYYDLKKSVKWYKCRLPFSLVFKGAPTGVVIRLINVYKVFIATCSFFFNGNRVLLREKITVVHLNSFALWPLLLVLPGPVKKVIHIREVPNNTIEARIAVAIVKRYATSIVPIDPISDRPFSGTGKSRVIFNPVDMRESRRLRLRKSLVKQEFGIPPQAFVVSIFGGVERLKGFDFFFSVVRNAETIDNLVFLVVGEPSEPFGEKCLRALKDQRNVICTGLHQDVSRLYAITDVVIRCEDYLPLGRTVWEGIFSGGLALVPVNEKDDTSVLKDLAGKYICTYKAGNVGSCIATLKAIMKKYPGTIADAGYPIADNTAKSAEEFLAVLRS